MTISYTFLFKSSLGHRNRFSALLSIFFKSFFVLFAASAYAKPVQIQFESEEGTWMSLSASPINEQLVFDHLGHIYLLESNQIQASCLTCDSSLTVNMRPVFSPSGQYIAYSSDKSGVPNVWIMRSDGSEKRIVAKAEEGRVGDIVWSKDEQFLYVTHAYTGIWRYEIAKGKRSHVYGDWKLSLGGLNTFDEPNKLLFHQYRGIDADLHAVDPAKGDFGLFVSENLHNTEQLTPLSTPGEHDLNPRLSPDESNIAFFRRNINTTKNDFNSTSLLVKSLKDGSEKVLLDHGPLDMAEGWTNYQNVQALPSFAWSSDGTRIIVNINGKINEINVKTGKINIIPFRVNVKRSLPKKAKASERVNMPNTPTLRHISYSNSTGSFVFSHQNKIWKLDSSTDKNEASLAFAEQEPRFFMPNADDKSAALLFVKQGKEGRARIVVNNLQSGESWTSPVCACDYYHPVYHAEGDSIYALKATSPKALSPVRETARQWQIIKFDMLTEKESVVVEGLPDFIREVSPLRISANHLFFFSNSFVELDASSNIYSVSLSDGKLNPAWSLPHIGGFDVSENGAHLAFEIQGNIYLIARSDMPSQYLKQEDFIRRYAGNAVTYGYEPKFKSTNVLISVLANKINETNINTLSTMTLDVTFPTDNSTDSVSDVLIKNAHYYSTEKATFIKGDIFLKNGIIYCLGKCSQTPDAKPVDYSGKFIIPGLIDAHGSNVSFMLSEFTPFDRWDQRAEIGFGITHSHHPVEWTRTILSHADMARSRFYKGPRISANGDRLRNRQASEDYDNAYVAINNKEDAQAQINLRKLSGAIGIITQSHEVDQDRQRALWLSQSAANEGMSIVAHGVFGSFDQHLAVIFDGYTGFEHTPGFLPVYQDFYTLLGATGTTYVMTAGLASGRHDAAEFFVARGDIHNNSLISRYWPNYAREEFIKSYTVERDPSNYVYPLISEFMCKLDDAGGNASMGTEGLASGIALHWEIEMFASKCGAAMAINAATINNARFLGLSNLIGSIEVGKLADLVVLNSSPLEDIKNTKDIYTVFKEGVTH